MTYYESWILRMINNGNKYVVDELVAHFGETFDVSLSQIVDFRNEVHRKMQESESFSVAHGYWWTILTYLDSYIQLCPEKE